ncbi:hypothetical protein [Paracoccus homiensis]|nr:hypothetical protein [Paracoccus homiensis]
MIELKPLSPVRSQQQQAALLAACFSGPFGQPVDDIRYRHSLCLQLSRQLGGAFCQKVDPLVARLLVEEVNDVGNAQQLSLSPTQTFNKRLRLAQSPDIWQVLIGHFDLDTLLFSIGPDSAMPLPVTRDDGGTGPRQLRIQFRQPHHLVDGSDRLWHIARRDIQQLNPALSNPIHLCEDTPLWITPAICVDPDVMIHLHPIRRRRNHRIGRRNDVVGGR